MNNQASSDTKEKLLQLIQTMDENQAIYSLTFLTKMFGNVDTKKKTDKGGNL